MKLTFIDCSCGNTKGFQLADKLAECTSCAQPVHIDTPVYHTYEVESLSRIEQRAKDKSFEDMYQDVDMYPDIPYIDWSTCFDVDNITVECDEPLHYHHDCCPSCSQIRVAV